MTQSALHELGYGSNFAGHWGDLYEDFPVRLPSRACVGVQGIAAGTLVEVDLGAWREDGWMS